MSLRRVMSNRAGGRCDIPTPTKSPFSIRSCTATEETPASVESGAGPLNGGGSWGTKRRVDFAIGDGESKASGSKSLKSKAYGSMQTRIRDAKNKREPHRDRAKAAGKPAAGKPAKRSNTTKRVQKSSGSRGSVEENDTRGRSLTNLLARALEAVEDMEENEYPKKSDCTALMPLAI